MRRPCISIRNTKWKGVRDDGMKKGKRGGGGGGGGGGGEELQGVTRKKRTATDLLVLTRLFGT